MVFSISVNIFILLVLFLWTTLTDRAGFSHITVVVQSLNCVWLYATPWTAARQAPLSSTISQSLLTFMSFEPVMPSNHLFLCHPFLLLPFYSNIILHVCHLLFLCVDNKLLFSFSHSLISPHFLIFVPVITSQLNNLYLVLYCKFYF